MSDEKKNRPGMFPVGNMAGEATRFKPGESGNPGGKPVGARNRLTAQFLYELAEDFDEHGADAIARCRAEDPATYVKVIAALCPKEVAVKRPLEEMEDADLLAAVRALEGFLAARSATEGNRDSGEPQQTH